LTQARSPMVANAGPEAAMQAVTAAIDSFISQVLGSTAFNTLQGIGVCAPGPLDPRTGIVINPPNLPCWRNFPLASRVADYYHVPVRIDNDANAAALAETQWGAARGYHYVFYATVGTGIGTGIVLDGRIYHGSTGAAGEGGHMSIDYRGPICGCGKHGCIEALAAGPAIARRAREKVAASGARSSTILGLAHGKVDSVTSEMVAKGYGEGDGLAKEILEETVELLTAWLGNIVDLMDPDVIVMGGGVAAMLSSFFPAIKERLPSWCVNSRCGEIPLLLAHYGADAGIAGGAALCSEPAS
jgi:glucokinase